jgi:tetratricopeptide (TPR) repeat protein
MSQQTGPAAQKLHEALTALQNNRPSDAHHAAAAALELFTNAGDRTGAAAAHQILAMLQIMAGRPEYALPHIDSAIPLREATGDWEGVAALWQERLEVSLRVGDLTSALTAAEGQVQAMANTTDREGQAHAVHQLAQLTLQSGDDEKAEELVQQALFALDGPGTERARAAMMLLYSSVWLHRKEADRALGFARQAHDLARQAKNRGAEVDALQHLGAIHSVRGELTLAKRVLEEALVGRELLKDLDGRANVLRELASVEMQLGSTTEGLDHLDYAARTMRELRNWVGEVTFLQLLQNAADEAGIGDRALQAARALVTAAANTGDREAEAGAQFALGTRLAGLGDLSAAAQAFSRARDLQLGLGLAHEAAVSGGMMGQVLVVGGKRDEGLSLLRGSLAQLDALGSEAADTLRDILAELEAGA